MSEPITTSEAQKLLQQGTKKGDVLKLEFPQFPGITQCLGDGTAPEVPALSEMNKYFRDGTLLKEELLTLLVAADRHEEGMGDIILRLEKFKSAVIKDIRNSFGPTGVASVALDNSKVEEIAGMSYEQAQNRRPAAARPAVLQEK